MHKIVFVFFVFVCRSVGAQHTDTSYFDFAGNRVEKNDRKMYFYSYKESDEKFRLLFYTHKHDLYEIREYSDSAFKFLDGNSVFFDKRKDTIEKIYFENGFAKEYSFYERGILTEKKVRLNDTVKYVYKLDEGKRIISKKLYYGDDIYHFHGKDSSLFVNTLRYAFREEERMKNYWIFKYKVLPWVMGDDGGMNYSLGIEFTFNKSHSFDLTGTYLDWMKDQDDSLDNNLPKIFEVRRGIQLGYRYYFQTKDMGVSGRIFISPFVRYSKFQEHYSEGAVTNYFRNEKWNYAAGLLLGFCIDGKDEDPFYTEIFIGPQYVYSRTIEGFESNNITIENEFYNRKIMLRFGMNFCGLMSRRK